MQRADVYARKCVEMGVVERRDQRTRCFFFCAATTKRSSRETWAVYLFDDEQADAHHLLSEMSSQFKRAFLSARQRQKPGDVCTLIFSAVRAYGAQCSHVRCVYSLCIQTRDQHRAISSEECRPQRVSSLVRFAEASHGIEYPILPPSGHSVQILTKPRKAFANSPQNLGRQQEAAGNVEH